MRQQKVTTYSVEYGDEAGNAVTHTFGTDGAAAQAMLDTLAGTTYAGDVTADDMDDVTEPWHEARGVKVHAVSTGGYEARGADGHGRGNWTVALVVTSPMSSGEHAAHIMAERVRRAARVPVQVENTGGGNYVARARARYGSTVVAFHPEGYAVYTDEAAWFAGGEATHQDSTRPLDTVTAVLPWLTVQHANYPHEAGTLYDCPACEAACHCDPDSSECIYSGEHTTFREVGAYSPRHYATLTGRTVVRIACADGARWTADVSDDRARELVEIVAKSHGITSASAITIPRDYPMSPLEYRRISSSS